MQTMDPDEVIQQLKDEIAQWAEENVFGAVSLDSAEQRSRILDNYVKQLHDMTGVHWTARFEAQGSKIVAQPIRFYLDLE